MATNLFQHMSYLRSEKKTIGITELKFSGDVEATESVMKIVDFDENWICVEANAFGSSSAKFLNIQNIASCVVVDFSRRKRKNDIA